MAALGHNELTISHYCFRLEIGTWFSWNNLFSAWEVLAYWEAKKKTFDFHKPECTVNPPPQKKKKKKNSLKFVPQLVVTMKLFGGGGGGGGILISLHPSVHPFFRNWLHLRWCSQFQCRRPFVRPSVHLSHILCPLCSAYSSGWIHFILIHLIRQLQRCVACILKFKFLAIFLNL